MAQIKADEITQLIRQQIENYETKVAVDEVGTVVTLGDGIARVYGLDKVMAGELLSFPHQVAGIAMNLPAYDASRIHHARISAADVHAVTVSLLALSRAERRRIGVLHPGRVDVIGGGSLVLDRIMQRFGFTEVLVSEHDILDGIAWALAADRPG